MERYFVLDKFNTFYDWRLILTAKSVPDPEIKTHYVQLDGMSGSLDFTEALAGEVTYEDRTITATFWTDYGNRKDREKLLRDIRLALHGKKIKIVEPDDPEHYFYGRVSVKSFNNTLAYAELTIEAICDPWRYAVEETERYIEVTSDVTNVIIYNNGAKTLSPIVEVNGSVNITCNGSSVPLTNGTFKVSTLKLKQGVNVIGVSGSGSVTFTYREADI